MMKLIVGLKGTGKTKTLIEMVNEAVGQSHGSVVCLELGDKLRFDISYMARLVDVSEYGIDGASELWGFVAGMLASNHDITHIFIDSALKICKNDIEKFENFVHKAAEMARKYEVEFVITSSVLPDDLSDEMHMYMKI